MEELEQRKLELEVANLEEDLKFKQVKAKVLVATISFTGLGLLLSIASLVLKIK